MSEGDGGRARRRLSGPVSDDCAHRMGCLKLSVCAAECSILFGLSVSELGYEPSLEGSVVFMSTRLIWLIWLRAITRGECGFWVPFVGLMLFMLRESLGLRPGVFSGRILGVPGTSFGSSETLPANSAGRT